MNVRLSENVDPPNGLYFSERAPWVDCPQARPVLERLVRLRDMAIGSFLGSSSNETRSTNEDAPLATMAPGPTAGTGETPGGESGVPADPRKITMRRSGPGRKRVRQVFERDRARCVACGTPDDLSVHHRTPRSEGGDNSLANLELLCWPCHRKEHNTLRAAVGIAAEDKAAAIDTRRAARRALKGKG